MAMNGSLSLAVNVNYEQRETEVLDSLLPDFIRLKGSDRHVGGMTFFFLFFFFKPCLSSHKRYHFILLHSQQQQQTKQLSLSMISLAVLSSQDMLE